MNVNLGIPYGAILNKIIAKGYAGNQTEAIRQALREYERIIDEEEALLVNKAVEIEMEKIEKGEVKTYSYNEVKKKGLL